MVKRYGCENDMMFQREVMNFNKGVIYIWKKMITVLVRGQERERSKLTSDTWRKSSY
jgi:hypothetical protein